MNNILYYFFLFFIYAVIGWIVEVIYVFIIDKKLVNRGFLIGPYIPIYGVCATIMTLYLTQYKDNPLTVFILAMFICSFIEYMTSYTMEKLFKARWWDYSNQKFNLNGRTCLLNTFLFGVLALVLIYIVNPPLLSLIDKINKNTLNIISVICLVIFLIDLVISTKVILNLKDKISQVKSDATIEIKKLVTDILHKKYLPTRILKAFPKVKFNLRSKKE